MATELVAREGQDLEALVLLTAVAAASGELVVDLHQLAVVDGGLASLGRHVHDDEDVALVAGRKIA